MEVPIQPIEAILSPPSMIPGYVSTYINTSTPELVVQVHFYPRESLLRCLRYGLHMRGCTDTYEQMKVYAKSVHVYRHRVDLRKVF